MPLVSLTLIRWTVIYLVDSTIWRLTNQGLVNLCVDTLEPRYNSGPRDWQNMFTITRFRHVEVLCDIFSYYWYRYIEVRFIEVLMYRGAKELSYHCLISRNQRRNLILDGKSLSCLVSPTFAYIWDIQAFYTRYSLRRKKGNFAKTPRTGYFLCLFLRTYRVITNNVVVIFMVYG